MKTRKFWGLFLALAMILTINLFPASSVDAAGTRRVLLIQSTKPWGSDTTNNLLAGLATSGVISGYDERTFAQVNDAGFDLSGYALVIIGNSQNYSDYNAGTKTKLEAYAQAGGVVLFGACYQSSTDISVNLPGNVVINSDPQIDNVISDSASPVVTGSMSDNVALVDADLWGNWCSHTTFDESTFPAGAHVILRAKTDSKPTLAEYPIGNGKVIVSGLTWEIAYNLNWAFAVKAYDDLILYALPYEQAAPTGLTGTATSFAGESDGKISGTTPAMEYKLSSDTVYTTASAVETTGLAAGTYDVRYAAKSGFMASPSVSVTVSEGPAHTYTLTVTAPSFSGILSSDPQPAAKPIVISNSGNSASTISGVTVSNTDFIVAGGGSTVSIGGSISSWTVQPAAGLAAGTHTATITVTYDGGAVATADVSIVVTQRVDAGAPVFSVNLDAAVSLINGVAASPLTVKADSPDNGTITYQWYMRSGDIVPADITPDALAGTAITGATGASYTPRTDAVGVFYYYVIATNTNNSANGTVTAQKVSAICKATVVPLVNAAAPSFSLNVGGTASIAKDGTAPVLTAKADAADGGTVTYQWYVKNGENGSYTAIPGATGATYTPGTSAAGVYYYFVKATNTNNSVNGTKTASRDSEVLKVTITSVLGKTGELDSFLPAAVLITAGLAVTCTAVLVVRKRKFH